MLRTIVHQIQILGNLLVKFSLLLFLNTSCYSQKGIRNDILKNSASEIINESIWVPLLNEEAHDLKLSDTATTILNLIFEREFDDCIKVFLNAKELYCKKITTVKNLSVVNAEFGIPYAVENKPLIEILQLNERRKIAFNPKQGYLLCYLNRINDIWTLEFSNYQRIYY